MGLGRAHLGVVLAVGYTPFVVHELFVPVVTAWVMGAILRPIVESAERHGAPRVVAVIATATVALLYTARNRRTPIYALGLLDRLRL
jgi:predicted PurR-regulated permease PerM